MNEPPGPFVKHRLQPPLLKSQCASPSSSVPQPPLFLANHLTGLYVWFQGEKSKRVSLEQSNSAPVPGRENFLWGDARWLPAHSDVLRCITANKSLYQDYLHWLVVSSNRKGQFVTLQPEPQDFHSISRKANVEFPEMGQNSFSGEIARPRLEKYAHGNDNIKAGDAPHGWDLLRP